MVSNRFLGAVAIKPNLPICSILAIPCREEIQETERESGGQKDFWVASSDPPKAIVNQCLPKSLPYGG